MSATEKAAREKAAIEQAAIEQTAKAQATSKQQAGQGGMQAPILLSASAQTPLLAEAALAAGWHCQRWRADLTMHNNQARVAMVEVGEQVTLDVLRQHFPQAIFISENADLSVDFQLTAKHKSLFEPILQQAAKHWRRGQKITELAKDVGMRRQRMHQLNEISLAL
ncbi:MAG: hypothetical protein AAF993_18380, partial [Pseudomonadota bacterium]